MKNTTTTKKMGIIATIAKRSLLALGLVISLGTDLKAQTFCQAAFTFTVGSGGQVAFTNTSTGTSGSTVYQWYFGDNTTANTQNPTHTYAYNGMYRITLMIDSSNGTCSSSVTDSVIISNGMSCTLNSAFTYTAGTNGNYSFTDASTGVNPGMTYSWSWQGSNSYGYSSQQSPSFNFPYNGTYNVTMTVGDSTQTCYSSVTQVITVTNSQPCVADFTYAIGSNGLVTFTNVSVNNTVFYWYFGDGNNSNAVSPSHTYYNGTYNVQMYADTINGACGGYRDTVITITNGQNAPTCNASFTYTLQAGGQVDFTNTSTTTIANAIISWTFGDGQSSSASNPSNIYSYNGSYGVTLNITDSATGNIVCSSYQTITVTSASSSGCNDSAYFYMYPDSNALSTWNVYLVSNNSYPINATWYWGDNTSSSGLFPSHTYANPGWYTICVYATFACGDSSYYCQTDSVYRSSSSMVTMHVLNPATSIKNNTQAVTTMKAFPNPFTDDITVNFNSSENKAVTFTMHDMMGNQLLKENVETHKGDNEFKINTNVMAKGVYFINVSDGKKMSTIKMIK